MRRALLLALLILAPGALALGDSPLLESARRHLRSNDDTIRADALLSLAEVDNVDAARLVLAYAHDKSWRVRKAVQEALERFHNESVIQFLVDTAYDPGKPQVAVALATAFGKARHHGAKELLLELLSRDSWTIQRAVIEAMGNLGDATLVPRLADFVTHSESTLRTVAVESLGQIGGDQALEPVLDALDDEAWQVRAAAIRSLLTFRSRECIAPLIERMAREDGRLAQDAWQALVEITGFTFDFDHEVWRSWWERSKYDFRPPPPRRATATASSTPKSDSGKRYAKMPVRYYGIPTASKRILFLLDASRSMNEEVDFVRPKVTDKKVRYAHERLEKEYASKVKIEIAKEELIDTISRLDDNTFFNVVVYETRIHPWQNTMVPAGSINKNRAIEFVRGQKARGAESVAPRSSRVDLEGRTNIFEGLEVAFQSAGIGVDDRHYRSAVDTIFLLSDGMPTAGKILHIPEILDEVDRMNSLRRVVIHTINIGHSGTLLEQLAERSGGTYVDLTPQSG
jgi:hypothetical protein